MQSRRNTVARHIESHQQMIIDLDDLLREIDIDITKNKLQLDALKQEGISGEDNTHE